LAPRHSTGLQIRRPTLLVQVQIPVVQQLRLGPLALKALTLIRLDLKLTLAAQVVDMARNGPDALPSPAQDLDHDLRGSADGAGDDLNLRRRQLIAPSRSMAGVAGDVQEHAGFAPDVN
jgi:hypothetical protein